MPPDTDPSGTPNDDLPAPIDPYEYKRVMKAKRKEQRRREWQQQQEAKKQRQAKLQLDDAAGGKRKRSQVLPELMRQVAVTEGRILDEITRHFNRDVPSHLLLDLFEFIRDKLLSADIIQVEQLSGRVSLELSVRPMIEALSLSNAGN